MRVSEPLTSRIDGKITEEYEIDQAAYAVLSMLNTDTPKREILAFIVRQAVLFTGAKSALIYQQDSRARQLRLLAAAGFPDQPELDRLMHGLMARHPSHADAPEVWTDVSGQAAFQHFGCALAVPLIIRDTHYGMLMLFYAGSQVSDKAFRLVLKLRKLTMLALENLDLREQAERTAISTERARLARDLHDSVTQTLFSANLIAEVLPRLWEKNQTEARIRLEDLHFLTKGALAEMRSLLLELRPEALLKAPLPEILRHLVNGAIGRAGIPIKMTVSRWTPVPYPIKIALYRIAQEGLNNVIKHADAERAWVRLEQHSDQVTLLIADNGRGFSTTMQSPATLGISGMRERAHSISALLSIKSKPGRGTRILALWQRSTAQGS